MVAELAPRAAPRLRGDRSPGAAIALTPLGVCRVRGAMTTPVLTLARLRRTQEVRVMVLGPDRPVVHAHDRDEDDGHRDEIEYESN